jgi:hypothetical protein
MRKILFIIVGTILVFSCAPKNHIQSCEFATKETRIEQLSKLIRMKSPVLDAYYDLYNVNLDSRSLPGPTDINYKIIIRVKPEDVTRWTENAIFSSFPHKLDWTAALLAHNNALQLADKEAEYVFKDGSGYLVVFRNGVIVMNYIIN